MPIAVDVVYAKADHAENIFDLAPYHPDARLILHKDLARVVLKTAQLLHQRHGWTLVLKDGLRPIEAQRDLMDTDIVRRNPHWLEEPRLLSAPGQGAHPRGMAIDVSANEANGAPVDMGTLFDAMVPESARDYDGFSEDILQNRAQLEAAFVESGEALSLPILPLESEWWDFRFKRDHMGRFEPLADADLPPSLQMGRGFKGDAAEEARLEQLAKDILLSL